ncbi:2-keto-3-deoxy-L-rhamnonate aldolase RhmA [Mycoplana sp. BE70]|uniref:HpcH/HpaI aldolase family protein n=1 Tax=Mycoplana sp. BE70 TaxID=2817775 RepID=UPI00285B5058|nr:aldolase/citrate lyase family protein [Mycoplana sp. BE70]MDR6756366.1 2-keto-3-deoxy-L-rhamnonate aldolase RhmA [Mycoplana sp. BE70]
MTISHAWMKPALASGAVLRGIMVSELKTPFLGAILDSAGMDFAILDQEHGSYGADMLATLIAGFRGGRCQPIVRVPEIRRDCFLTPLEMGAAGVLVPRVETADQARAIVDFCRYAPSGSRGVSLSRAHTGFARVSASEYLARANKEILIGVQIETAEALDSLDDILAVEGVDMAFIGPSDLSVSCGISANLRAPEMASHIDNILAACRRHGKIGALQTTDWESAMALVPAGLAMISATTDLAALQHGLRAALAALPVATPGG